jgi:hypothetical protein
VIAGCQPSSGVGLGSQGQIEAYKERMEYNMYQFDLGFWLWASAY